MLPETTKKKLIGSSLQSINEVYARLVRRCCFVSIIDFGIENAVYIAGLHTLQFVIASG